MRMRGLGAALAASALLALSACGGGSVPNPGGGLPNGGDDAVTGGSLTIDLDVTGESTVKGSTSMLAPGPNLLKNTCADYAKGVTQDGLTLFAVPSLIGAAKVNGKEVLIEAEVSHYAGAGSYGQDTVSGMGSDESLSVDGKVYSAVGDISDDKVTVDGKGNGTWTFTRLVVDDGSGVFGQGITGKVTWTCKDA